jgi:rRNA processing protein Gar1
MERFARLSVGSSQLEETYFVIKPEPQSEGQKFDAVMRKILSVSKEELQKREKAWRRKRARAKKKRALS